MKKCNILLLTVWGQLHANNTCTADLTACLKGSKMADEDYEEALLEIHETTRVASRAEIVTDENGRDEFNQVLGVDKIPRMDFSNRDFSVDWLRWMANWIVVFVHILEAAKEKTKNMPVNLNMEILTAELNGTQMGMPLFFGLAGLAAAYTNNHTFTKFFTNKVRRLLIPLLSTYFFLVIPARLLEKTVAHPQDWNSMMSLPWSYVQIILRFNQTFGFQWTWFLAVLFGIAVTVYAPLHLIDSMVRRIQLISQCHPIQPKDEIEAVKTSLRTSSEDAEEQIEEDRLLRTELERDNLKFPIIISACLISISMGGSLFIRAPKLMPIFIPIFVWMFALYLIQIQIRRFKKKETSSYTLSAVLMISYFVVIVAAPVCSILIAFWRKSLLADITTALPDRFRARRHLEPYSSLLGRENIDSVYDVDSEVTSGKIGILQFVNNFDGMEESLKINETSMTARTIMAIVFYTLFYCHGFAAQRISTVVRPLRAQHPAQQAFSIKLLAPLYVLGSWCGVFITIKTSRTTLNRMFDSHFYSYCMSTGLPVYLFHGLSISLISTFLSALSESFSEVLLASFWIIFSVYCILTPLMTLALIWLASKWFVTRFLFSIPETL